MILRRYRDSSPPRRGRGLRVAAGLAVLLAGPAALSAQDAPDPAPPPAPRRAPPVLKQLTFGLSLFESYDHTVLSDAMSAFAADPRFQPTTRFTAVNATMNFSSATARTTFGATGAVNARHFSVLPRQLPTDVVGAVNMSTQVRPRITVRAAQRVSYSPYYSFGLTGVTGAAGVSGVAGIPGVTGGADPLSGDSGLQSEQHAAALDTYSAGSSGSLTWTATNRTAADLRYDLEATAIRGTQGGVTQAAGGGISHRLTQYAQVRLGYGYRHAQVGTVSSHFDTHDIDTGFGYQRPLPGSRRTVVGFNTGAVVVARDDTRAITATGSGSITHQFARTWSIGSTYSRSVAAFTTVADPYIVDSVSGNLGGGLSRRAKLSGSGGYSRGRAAIGVRNGFHTAFAQARVQYTFARFLPVFGEYVFYHNQFEQPAGLVVGFPIYVRRHGVRAGVSYTVPLVTGQVR